MRRRNPFSASEVQRQFKIKEAGGQVALETRGYDEQTKATFLLRHKEDVPDYRFLPDANLPLLVIRTVSVVLTGSV